jgi:alpha 1,3-glucosidase
MAGHRPLQQQLMLFLSFLTIFASFISPVGAYLTLPAFNSY